MQAYLVSEDLPLEVVVSEDGTRITGKIEYDPRTNLCVGFVPRIDNNGLPDTTPYLATSESAIKHMFKEAPKAKNAYTIMV